MKYYLGIDGGGTTTKFALCDIGGKTVLRFDLPPCRNNKKLDDDVLRQGLERLIDEASIKRTDIKSCAFGMPGYGEFPEEDRKAHEQIEEVFGEIPVSVCNDVEVGWAAALGLQPGINVVSGTGSIAFGKDTEGGCARAGGWWSNLGSGKWLGTKAVDLFLKMNECILPKTQIYDIVWDAFGLKEKEDIFAYTTKHLINDRKNLAAVQMLLNQAADKGDIYALKLYEEAASELAQLAKGCRNQLSFTDKARVSYTGSVFKVGDKLMKPFKENLEAELFEVVPPIYETVYGAVLLGASKFCPENVKILKQGLPKDGIQS